MSGFDLYSSEGRPDRPIWFIIAAMTVVLVGLAIGSAIEYSSIVVAKATVSFEPTTIRTFQGTESNGSLTPDGSLTVSLVLAVDNPSTRTLHLQLLAFSLWVEDGPAESGLNESRRISDAFLSSPNGTRYFFLVFVGSREVSENPVPAGATPTYTFTYTLSRAVNPARFAVLRNITDFWASTAGDVGAASWFHWVRLTLVIDGVLPATSPTAASYLRAIGRIDREEGTNLVA